MPLDGWQVLVGSGNGGGHPTDRLFTGIHTRDNGRVVNPLKAQATHQHPRRRHRRGPDPVTADPHALEQALEFIDEDELVEV